MRTSNPVRIAVFCCLAVCAACGHSGLPGSGSGGGPGGTATVNVTSVGPGKGTVTVTGTSFTCASGMSCKLPLSGNVTLSANPDASSSFIGWEGACGGSNCVVSPAMNGATATVRFGLNGYASKVVSGASNSVLRGVARAIDGGVLLLAVNSGTGTDYGDGKLVTGLALARYGADGSLLKVFPFQGATDGAAVVLDVSGNIVVAGTFAGTMSFPGGTLTSQGSTDAFIVKYTPAGVYSYAAGYGGSGGAATAIGIAIDGYNRMTLLGTYGASINFGGVPALILSGGPGVFLMETQAFGPPNWATKVAPPSAADGYVYAGVGVDQKGAAYIGGNSTAPGATRALDLQFFDATGAFRSRLTLPGASTTHLRLGSIAVDASGNAVFTGDFAGTMDFGAGSVTTPSTTSSAIFLARYSTGLTAHLWSKELMLGGNNDQGNAAVLDYKGNIYLAGKLHAGSRVDFGGGAVTASFPSGFVAEWTSAGTPVWSQLFAGGPSSVGDVNTALSAGVNNYNDLAVAGVVQGDIDLGDAIRSSPATTNALFTVKVPAAH